MSAISRRHRAIHAATCSRASVTASNVRPSPLESCLLARQLLPALHDHVGILRVQFDAVTNALRDFSCGQRGATSQERLVNQFAAIGVVEDRTPHQFHGLSALGGRTSLHPTRP